MKSHRSVGYDLLQGERKALMPGHAVGVARGAPHWCLIKLAD